jgi:hypothetical protein
MNLNEKKIDRSFFVTLYLLPMANMLLNIKRERISFAVYTKSLINALCTYNIKNFG